MYPSGADNFRRQFDSLESGALLPLPTRIVEALQFQSKLLSTCRRETKTFAYRGCSLNEHSKSAEDASSAEPELGGSCDCSLKE